MLRSVGQCSDRRSLTRTYIDSTDLRRRCGDGGSFPSPPTGDGSDGRRDLSHACARDLRLRRRHPFRRRLHPQLQGPALLIPVVGCSRQDSEVVYRRRYDSRAAR
ncbi:hypothetical protein C4D60_Mb09t13420 [Musa balbisiana]|uniref:Uncharacterized protein n=1 Tax=Musa balbisiana TaxID=52838 RepID=A0A4S8IG88_MUSBA|nr:hypothetical protein C4D60_Mb09t13420 [Musa balbisiana]